MPGGFQSPRDSNASKYGALVGVHTINHAPKISPDRVIYSGVINVGVKGHEDFADLCGKYHVSAEVSRDEFDQPELITQKDLEQYAHG